jgi:hypothetical protein
MNAFRAGMIAVTLLVCCFLGGCFSALDPDEKKEDISRITPMTDTTVSDGGPLVLVHYMPWYRGPSAKSQETTLANYGGHWTGWGKLDPATAKDDGRANIYARQYPLTGPYDQLDTNLLEYQAALFRLAGIDGVIFDWYGSRDVNDFGEIHEHTKAMVTVLKKAGLKFCVCYEDNTLNMEYGGNAQVPAETAVESGKEIFAWMQQNWFRDSAYVRYQGRPLVLCFGPQYFNQTQWAEIFTVTNAAPYFVDLDNRTGWADASYNWPPMSRSVNGELSIDSLQNYLNSFYTGKQKDKPYKIATAFPAFDDVYEDTGGTSYGNLAYNNGATFKLTFDAAEAFGAQVIQIATWNDYGEGTIIEPTIERGYTELEYLQDRQKEWSGDFPYTKEELRAPLEFFKLLYTGTATADQKNAIRAAYTALFSGDAAAFRSAAESAGISFELSVKPLLRK